MTIEERVDKLEHTLARARFIVCLMAVICIGLLLAIWFFASGTKTAQERVLDEVRAPPFIYLKVINQ